MLYRSDALLKQVISELELTQEDIQLFTPPKQFHDHYVRNIIYNLSKHQMGLFLNVVRFDDNITTLQCLPKLQFAIAKVCKSWQKCLQKLQLKNNKIMKFIIFNFVN